jgi:hypothetical protein
MLQSMTDLLIAGEETGDGKDKSRKKQKGIYEHPKGSGIWWVLWYDAQGERHRERRVPKPPPLS